MLLACARTAQAYKLFERDMWHCREYQIQPLRLTVCNSQSTNPILLDFCRSAKTSLNLASIRSFANLAANFHCQTNLSYTQVSEKVMMLAPISTCIHSVGIPTMSYSPHVSMTLYSLRKTLIQALFILLPDSIP